ncbi:MAG: helix-turn-helix domain-containing protein [Ruminococcus sp.]|uniref:helix-turn-helix domain-containing protein n=1 Tax=Ruminococcus sp. TaxID=41978 RepID=UPI00260077E0|nr:helix-turn-helix domain-containing protein [Ruminococcus sp.]MBO4867957.1 helix-turn-helix domain-containing protein [Ruminococcus sp.]
MEKNVICMLGIPETADAFGISQHYARQLALQGKVKAVRVGKGKILINQQSVSEYFSNCYLNEHEGGER